MLFNGPIPVWLDCDTGNDDVFAILFASFHPRIKLVGISTVHGNAPLEKTTHNTLTVLDLLQVDCPVYPGEAKPLVVDAKFALDIHGEQGLGGVDVSRETIRQAETGNYLQAMKLAIDEYDKLNIVCTGALTNLSRLITAYPNIDEKLNYVSIMGGGLDLGNVTQYSEFNFHVDPHAANHVISKIGRDKIILSPLNLTHQVRANEAIRNQIYNTQHHTAFRLFFYNVLMFYYHAYIDKYVDMDGPPIHDPVAVYSLFPWIDQDFKKYGYEYLKTPAKVVETGLKQGQLVLDEKNLNEIYIGVKVDVKLFWQQLLQVLELAETHVGKVVTPEKTNLPSLNPTVIPDIV